MPRRRNCSSCRRPWYSRSWSVHGARSRGAAAVALLALGTERIAAWRMAAAASRLKPRSPPADPALVSQIASPSRPGQGRSRAIHANANARRDEAAARQHGFAAVLPRSRGDLADRYAVQSDLRRSPMPACRSRRQRPARDALTGGNGTRGVGAGFDDDARDARRRSFRRSTPNSMCRREGTPSQLAHAIDAEPAATRAVDQGPAK